MSDKARKNTAKGHWNIIRSHNITNYFNSTLINNGCRPYQTDLWMGHELGESKGAYIIPDRVKQKEIYMQYINFLTLGKHLDLTENPDYLRMRSENERFARLAATATIENEELLC